MDKKYIELFKELAGATAISAEKVMDYNVKKDDKQGYETAKIMRDNYEELKEQITNAGDNYLLNKADAAKLTVAAFIIVNQLQDHIANLKKAMAGYQTDVIPKLQAIVDEAKTDEDAAKIAEEKFIIEDNK